MSLRDGLDWPASDWSYKVVSPTGFSKGGMQDFCFLIKVLVFAA